MHRSVVIVALLLLVSLMTPSPSAAGLPPDSTNVLYGFLFADFTMTASAPGPDWYIIGDLFVQPGATLRIQPGVTVYFAADHDTLNSGDYFYDSEIICAGTLIAAGTESDSIRFISDALLPQKGQWGQIKFSQGSSGAFEYCLFRGGTRAVRSETVHEVSMSRCQIEEMAGSAITGQSADVTLDQCSIRNIDGQGVGVWGGTLTATRNALSNIRMEGLYVENVTGAIDRNVLEDSGGYNVSGSNYSGIAVINSSPTIRWNRVSRVGGTGIVVDGFIEPITLLGDSVYYAQDRGISMNNAGVDTIRSVVVHGSGSDGVRLSRPGSAGQPLVCENVLVTRSGSYGIVVLDANVLNKAVRISYCTVAYSGDAGILLEYWGKIMSIDVDNCILASNVGRGIFNQHPETSFRFLDVWGNIDNYPYGTADADTACYSINPLFVSAAADDFHLLPNSPCRVLGEDGTQLGRYGPETGEVVGVGGGTTDRWLAGALQNWPNPFQHATTITIMAKGATVATMEVFDVAGRLVRAEVPLPIHQGANEIPFTRGDLSSGVYFYRVSGPGFESSQKMLIVD